MNEKFNKWLDKFIKKNGIELDKVVDVHGNNGSYKFEIASIVLHMKNSKETLQKIYKKRLKQLDFIGANIVEVFFKELAESLVPNLFKEVSEVELDK